MNNVGGAAVTPSAASSLTRSPREYFYYFLNIESYPELLPEAKAVVEAYLSDARRYMLQDDPHSDIPWLCTFNDFNHESFEKRCADTFDALMQMCYTGWLDKGMPPKWYSGSKEKLSDFLINEAPFHLTDGAWLRGSVPVGTMNATEAALFKIYIDEMGNGEVHMNHPNVYNDVLRSLGIYMPPVTSRAFIEQESIVDGAFTNPMFPLAVSLLPRTYAAEILGMTLWLELSSASLHAPQAKVLEQHGLSPLFSRLHMAIDNPTAGHSFLAKEAVRRYLDDLRAREGEKVMRAHWRRIWDGFTAFAITGGYHQELRQKWERDEKTPARDRVVELIRRKAPAASLAHGPARLAGKLVNEWFSDPEGFVDALSASAWVVPGDPGESAFLKRLTVFEGPMFQVFTNDELTWISKWILSLKVAKAPHVLRTESESPVQEGFLYVADAEDLNPGNMIGVRVENKPVVLCNVNGAFHAIAGVCTHQDALLEQGELDGSVVMCPLHNSGFNVQTGEAVCLPAEKPVAVFDVVQDAGRLLVSKQPRVLA